MDESFNLSDSLDDHVNYNWLILSVNLFFFLNRFKLISDNIETDRMFNKNDWYYSYVQKGDFEAIIFIADP